MKITEQLKLEMQHSMPEGSFFPAYFRAIGYRNGSHSSPAEKRADGIVSLFTETKPFIYQNDLIVGCMRSGFVSLSTEEKKQIKQEISAFPERDFWTNSDHFSPDYETVLSIGIDGLLQKIADSEKQHAANPQALHFLNSTRLVLEALQQRIAAHADCAKALIGADGYNPQRLQWIASNCEHIIHHAPKTFAQGLQLIWMIHTCFLLESRYAMALGRLDQYLYPLYRRDIDTGVLTQDEAIELLENVFMKICERHFLHMGDDTVNICIGGVDREGNCAVNELSTCIVRAVKHVQFPGPNLSARMTPDTPDDFWDECLKSIGTGLGYPALMNDVVNMAALRRFGYAEEDVRNYSMVGCIENFITGMQPPWSDGSIDVPRFLEYVMLGGEGYDKDRKGIQTAPLHEITSMEQFMKELEKQIAFGVKEKVQQFIKRNTILHPEQWISPFLSCFCKDCIERGKDINMGGARYPSVHGEGIMGVGTVSDSLAAIEKVVFCDHEASLDEIANAMRANFEGYESLREKLLAAPKYGNNDDFVDKYAVWFVNYLSGQFDRFRTPDGGGMYVSMGSNVHNIYAGRLVGATPDGRGAGEPFSDAASPTYGRDTKGATSTLLSTSKPNYDLCAVGTVLNQKYSPAMFEDGKREKLLQLIKVYFSRGGQEIQINATSRDVLIDAMEHPEQYASLVVRVSGYSALYITLPKEVQEDILNRTEQG